MIIKYLTVFLFLTLILCANQTTIKKHVMKAALKRGVEVGVLVQVRASYKLSAEAKKAAAASKKLKKPTKAKTTLKKKVGRRKHCFNEIFHSLRSSLLSYMFYCCAFFLRYDTQTATTSKPKTKKVRKLTN